MNNLKLRLRFADDFWDCSSNTLVENLSKINVSSMYFHSNITFTGWAGLPTTLY